MSGEIKVINGPARGLPDNFDIRHMRKSEIIDARVNAYFKQNAGKSALVAILTLPLAPIVWPLAYAIIRYNIKQDYVNALAAKRIELLKGPEGRVGVAIRQQKESLYTNPPRPENGPEEVMRDADIREASDIEDDGEIQVNRDHSASVSDQDEDSYRVEVDNDAGAPRTQREGVKEAYKRFKDTPEFDLFERHFKAKRHGPKVFTHEMPLEIRGSTPKEQWNNYKAARTELIRKNNQLRRIIQNKLRLSDQQANEFIDANIYLYATMKFSNLHLGRRSRLMNESFIHEALQFINNGEKLLQTNANEAKKIGKEITEGKANNAKKIEKEDDGAPSLNSEYNYVLETLTDETYNGQCLMIRNGTLPVPFELRRDAPNKLSGYCIGNIVYPESPIYSHLASSDSQKTVLLYDDEHNSKLQHLLETKVLREMIALYEKITAENPTMSEESKKRLWVILQLSRTQGLRSKIKGVIANAVGIQQPLKDKQKQSHFFGEKIEDSLALEHARQKTFVEYHYDQKNAKLNIVTHERHYLSDNQKLNMGQFLYYKVQVEIDLKNENTPAACKILDIRTYPAAKQSFFDRLQDGGEVKAEDLEIES